jgi:hypothetical protein
MRELRNTFDQEISFSNLAEAKHYYTPSEPSEYADAIQCAATLKELADVLNRHSDEYDNGSKYYIYTRQ